MFRVYSIDQMGKVKPIKLSQLIILFINLAEIIYYMVSIYIATIDLSNQSAGYYLLKTQTDKEIFTEKK